MFHAFNQIFVVIKSSALQMLQREPDFSYTFKKLSQERQENFQKSHDNQVQFIANLKTALKQYNIETKYVYMPDMDKIHPQENDLVISCGGDGMFLACAQRYPSSFLLGMNSDYQKSMDFAGSYGALIHTNQDNLEQHLSLLFSKKYTISYWRRLQAAINDQPMERLAVNDIFYGQALSYTMCKLRIYFQNLVQTVQCSGIITTTAMGSHAWYYNSGGVPFDNHLNLFAFSIFCPNRKHKLSFDSGILSDKDEIIIVPVKDDYILCFDSKNNVIATKMGDKISLFLAPKHHSLKVISFS